MPSGDMLTFPAPNMVLDVQNEPATGFEHPSGLIPRISVEHPVRVAPLEGTAVTGRSEQLVDHIKHSLRIGRRMSHGNGSRSAQDTAIASTVCSMIRRSCSSYTFHTSLLRTGWITS